jgi:uncharacterized protein YdeI (YjbR/CyaY-like superfamily)
MKRESRPVDEKPILSFEQQQAWAAWLDSNHATSSGVWLRLAKKASGVKSLSHGEALDIALCYGWIDGQAKSDSDGYWLQKFTPRGLRSTWSKRNREKVAALIESGQMTAAGLAEVERAKMDGRWDAAYDSPSQITVPADLQTELDNNRAAKTFFESLDGRNRYSILFRIHTAKKAETRTRRIRQFITMLARNEKIYP